MQRSRLSGSGEYRAFILRSLYLHSKIRRIESLLHVDSNGGKTFQIIERFHSLIVQGLYKKRISQRCLCYTNYQSQRHATHRSKCSTHPPTIREASRFETSSLRQEESIHRQTRHHNHHAINTQRQRQLPQQLSPHISRPSKQTPSAKT